MLPTLARRSAQQILPYYLTNPYKVKRSWPPDFSKLPPKHQFRYERKFKRRAQLKWARPKFMKKVKMLQFSSIIGEYTGYITWIKLMELQL